MASQLQAETVRIAVVGDVHDQWDEGDAIALAHLNIDLVLFVGDFGNEAVEIVAHIADLPIPKAVILGNHDAWYTATPWGRRKSPYDRRQEDRVQQQLDLLGETHVGYGKLDFPAWGLSVVGGRPFSWGGSDWKNTDFYQTRFGVSGWEHSIQRLIHAVDRTTQDTLIFIGHCGPTGLGDRPESLCGRDWNPIGGDFGDPDLAAAIAHAQRIGKRVPLVTFGHMHHHLRHRRDRLREVFAQDAAGTHYLNAARVPRIVPREGGCDRNFSVVTLRDRQVEQVEFVWIDHTLAVTREVIFTAPTSLGMGG
ncbi:MAG: TIGR04168 family protein [Leptolyngbyaceae cyanobacterium T60_A2020_046]|nr:TIGR04168 family protein [Leptolyngbyaceae cyanobacterium T60_A2020_046]